MRIKNILAGVGSLVFTVLLWLLQMIPEPENEQFKAEHSDVFMVNYNLLWSNKVYIGVFLFLFSALMIIINNFYLYSKPHKRWLCIYMDHVMKVLFQGEYGTTRITIFKIRYGYKFILLYCGRAFIKCFWSHWKDGLLWEHVKNIPNPFKKYICMYARCSNPHQGGSSTYFPIAKEATEISGIVSKCIYNKRIETIETDMISDFFTPKKMLKDYNKKERGRIANYEKANYLNFQKMRCIHRLSNHLYAEPIYDNKENLWGVFVVDIESPSSNVISNNHKGISNAVQVISLSLNHFK